MRLEELEKNAIIDAVMSIDPTAELHLFGSRVDDFARGGDIDLLVISDTMDRCCQGQLEDQIFKSVEEQKIDFVFTNRDLSNAFAAMILKQGTVRLTR